MYMLNYCQLISITSANTISHADYIDYRYFFLQLHNGTSQPAKLTVIDTNLVEAIDQEVFEGFTSSTSTNNSSTRV